MRQSTWRSPWLGGRYLPVFAAYVAMVIFAVSFYEPWEDEGRAWMIARSYGLWDMVFHILRYEGHPALWYLILWGPAHLHVPFVAINGFSAAVGCMGIWFLLRYAPFPFWLKAVLPFGFWLGFEYAVVARDYVFFPLFVFAAAHFYRQLPERPLAMAATLGLLANSSVYGTLVALGFAFAYGLKAYQEWAGRKSVPKQRRVHLQALALFGGSILLVAICVWPPHDLHAPFSPSVRKTLGHVVPVEYVSAERKAPVLNQPTSGTGESVQAERLQTRLWLIFAYPIVGLWTPTVSCWAAALMLEAFLLAFLRHRRALWLLLPLALLCGFMATVYDKVWHTGLVWVTLLALVWAAWDDTQIPSWRSWQGVTALLLAGSAAVQVCGTFGAIRYEMHHMTYPAEATAKYLKTLPRQTTLDGNSFVFTLLPYFDDNPFTNYNPQRYRHRGLYPDDESISQMVTYAPDVILLRGSEDGHLDGNERTELEAAGYALTHTFCGASYYPGRPIQPICFLAFARTSRS